MKFSFLFFVILLSSCLKEKRIIFYQDFEKPSKGWNQQELQTGSAHSGKFFARTDSVLQLSPAFREKLSDIAEQKIKRIDAVVWTRKSTDRSYANFIVSLDRNDQNVFLKSDTAEISHGDPNVWIRVFVSYDLPDSVGKDEVLSVFLRNQSGDAVDADDFEVRLYY